MAIDDVIRTHDGALLHLTPHPGTPDAALLVVRIDDPKDHRTFTVGLSDSDRRALAHLLGEWPDGGWRNGD